MTICARDDCDLATTGKSKYCSTHRKEARERWLEMVNQQNFDRANRDERFRKVWEEAYVRGQKAGASFTPTPMIVKRHVDPLDDSSCVEESHFVGEGVCGFALLIFRPGNHPFVNWLRKHPRYRVHKHYYGGCSYSIMSFGQSFEKKLACARAMADYFREANIEGLRVSVDSRLD